MKRLNKGTDSVKFRGEDSSELTVRWTNRGEPYREGVELSLDEPDYKHVAGVFLERREAVELRDLLNRLYPPSTSPLTRPAPQEEPVPDHGWLRREIASIIHRKVKPTTHPHFVDRLELSGASEAAEDIVTLVLTRPHGGRE